MNPTIYLPVRLDLADGLVWIPCRDVHQAALIVGCWIAWFGGARQDLGLSPRTDRWRMEAPPPLMPPSPKTEDAPP